MSEHEAVIAKWAGESSLRCSCGNWRGRNLVDTEGHEAHRRAVDRSTWTLRDLLRLAHHKGMFLSRTRSGELRSIYQVWEPLTEPDPERPWAHGRRWVEVDYWPSRARIRGSSQPGPTWHVRLNGRERPTKTTHHMAYAELWDPSIAEIVGALDWLGLLEPTVPDYQNEPEGA